MEQFTDFFKKLEFSIQSNVFQNWFEDQLSQNKAKKTTKSPQKAHSSDYSDLSKGAMAPTTATLVEDCVSKIQNLKLNCTNCQIDQLHYKMDMVYIKGHLCQNCFSKIAEEGNDQKYPNFQHVPENVLNNAQFLSTSKVMESSLDSKFFRP